MVLILQCHVEVNVHSYNVGDESSRREVTSQNKSTGSREQS